MNRDVIVGVAAVGLVVAVVAILATAVGRSDIGFPLIALAYWLGVIVVVRPYVYERFGNEVGDWIIVILILGPATLLVAPFLWWQHHRSAVARD